MLSGFRKMPAALIVVASWLVCAAAWGQAPLTQLKMESECLSATFDEKARGALASLVDTATGRELIAPQKDHVLFQLKFSESSEPSAKTFVVRNGDAANVQFFRDGDVGRIVFSQVGKRPIQVQCRFEASKSNMFLRCRIEATFPEPLVLEEVQFPVVTLRLKAAEESDDAVVLGRTKGGIHHRPAALKVGQGVSATQPGSLAAQFGCWYDSQVGLFTAALDQQGYRKKIDFSRNQDGLASSWTMPMFETKSFTQDFDLVLTTFHGADATTPPDWRDAADLYKRWAVRQPWCRRTFAERDDLPAWLKKGPAMVRFNRDWLDEPASIKAWLRDYWKHYFPDLPPLIIAYWGWEKVDTWITPDYFPVHPSDEAFRDLTAFGRTLGGHSFAWPSGYHYTLTHKKLPDGTFFWDDRKRFEQTAREHAVYDRDGKLFQYKWLQFWLAGGQNACLCPGDPWTIDGFNHISTELAKRGVDMIQLDQVVGGNFPPCYRKEHGHPAGPGLWMTDVFRKQMKTLLVECRKIQPEAVVCYEEPNEHFIQEAGIQDYRDWEVFRKPNPNLEPASVFAYVYHEYLPLFQSNLEANNRMQAAWCLANGQIPHLIPHKIPGEGEPLLKGGDFEKARDSLPWGWDKVAGYQGKVFAGESSRDDAQRHGGLASLRLSNTATNDVSEVAQNLLVGKTFAAGRTYELSAWMKTQNVEQPNQIRLAALALGKPLHYWSIQLPKAQNDWAKGQVRFTVPTEAETVRIMLILRGPGKAWIDDMRLDEVLENGTLAEVKPPDVPADHEFMQRWVKLFNGPGRPYLFFGRFLRPPRLECATQDVQGRTLPVIFHNAFAAPDGSEAVVMVNATAKPQAGRLLWKGSTQDVRLAPWEAQLIHPE